MEETCKTRLMVLKKQHYMETYPQAMKSRYTCWGYYDGIDVSPIKEPDRLYEKKSNAAVSIMWPGNLEKSTGMSAYYSSHNIGIFRFCEDENDAGEEEIFWEKKSEYPYILIGFIQLNDRLQSLNIAKKIELEYSTINADTKAYDTIVRKIMVYHTFDNADMVMIAKGNNLRDLEELGNKLSEHYNEIVYIHTILGVSESFLEEVSKIKRSENDFIWENNRDFPIKGYVYDDIAVLSLHIVSDGTKGLLQKLYNLLWEFQSEDSLGTIKNLKSVEHSFRIGHSDSNIVISETDVFSLLKLVCAKKPGTHQNPLFGHGLYNIESYFHTKKQPLSSESGVTKQYFPTDSKSWCDAKISICKELLTKSQEKNEEYMYAYCIGMIRTLSALGQHERFMLSNDLYCIVYPAFNMFLEQLNEAVQDLADERSDNNYYIKRKYITDSINVFLGCVNSILQHMIHTDQTFLMMPGQAGTDYSIPLKLTLMYHWLLRQLIIVLNDSDYTYECIFSPVIEISPQTDIIGPQINNLNRLIRIQASQRTLYAPRHLMLILCHEVGHYVGGQTRCREERSFFAAKWITNCICDNLWNDELSQKISFLGLKKKEVEKTRKQFLEKLSEQIIRYLISSLTQMSKDADDHIDKHFYARETKDCLLEMSIALLMEKNGILDDMIMKQLPDFIFQNDYFQKQTLKQIKILYILQNEMKKRCIMMILNGTIADNLDIAFHLFSELYSDVVAKEILNFSRQDFIDTFSVSEGVNIISDYDKTISERSAPDSQMIRQWILDNIYFKDIFQSASGSKKVDHGTIKAQMAKLYGNEIYLNILREYVIACKKKLEIHLSKHSNEIEKVRDLYKCFFDDEKSASEIYLEILKKGSDFIHEILNQEVIQ